MDAHHIGAAAPGLVAPVATANTRHADASSNTARAKPHLRLNTPKASTAAPDTAQSQEQNALPDLADDGGAVKSCIHLATRFTLRGYTLRRLSDDTHPVNCATLFRKCVDLNALRRFLSELGGTE